jgi:hypothetical protein
LFGLSCRRGSGRSKSIGSRRPGDLYGAIKSQDRWKATFSIAVNPLTGLVVGHVLEVNPAHAVRGPKYSQKKSKTPVLDRDEARVLLAAIDTSSPAGMRDVAETEPTPAQI